MIAVLFTMLIVLFCWADHRLNMLVAERDAAENKLKQLTPH
jgi:hypothetical protein